MIQRKVGLSIVRRRRATIDIQTGFREQCVLGQTGREGVGGRLLAGLSPASLFVSTDEMRIEFEATLIFYIEARRKNISVCEFVNWNHCHKHIAQRWRA